MYQSCPVQNKRNTWLPVLFVAAMVITRVPGILPPDFSAVYAFVFCAGVFLPGRMAWGVPLGVLFAADILLICYCRFSLAREVFSTLSLLHLASNYVGYALLIALGRRFRPGHSFMALLGDGLLNPFHNPEYVKTLLRWFKALTTGTSGEPEEARC